GPTHTLFARLGAERGKVPNMFRAFAHRPEIVATLVAHLEAVTGSGTVSRRTKELVATLVSRLNDCGYCDRSHTRQAATAGASEGQLIALMDFESGPFSEAEKVALAYAKQLTLDAHRIDDALFARLREHYDEGEVIELSAMAGLFNYFNRVNDALQFESTKAGEGL
ncbi:MAG TPA: carboxymuconolactone decarboxylase family protein, partial [Thermoanaerobaculia bacterium]|nr:carboxymuconolactone decarboxylase family protein [Thermoanaerobaculia bacterium]